MNDKIREVALRVSSRGLTASADAVILTFEELTRCLAELSKDVKPVAWRYENRNVKGNWYITWTEPNDKFNKRALYEYPPLTEQDKLDAARWKTFSALMFIGDVEILWDDERGYGISIEPAENITGAVFWGSTPEEALDRAMENGK